MNDIYYSDYTEKTHYSIQDYVNKIVTYNISSFI